MSYPQDTLAAGPPSWRRRLKITLLFGLVVIIGIICFLLWERVRGAYALKQKRNQLIQRGEHLELTVVAPPKPPAQQNSAAVLAKLTNEQRDKGRQIHAMWLPVSRYASAGKAIVPWQIPHWRAEDKVMTW